MIGKFINDMILGSSFIITMIMFCLLQTMNTCFHIYKYIIKRHDVSCASGGMYWKYIN